MKRLFLYIFIFIVLINFASSLDWDSNTTAYFRMESIDGGQLINIVNNSRNFTIYGNTTTISGKINNALNFSSTTNDSGIINNYLVGNYQKSVSIWVKPSPGLSSTQMVFSSGTASLNKGAWGLGWNYLAGDNKFWIHGQGSDAVANISSAAGSWYHVVITQSWGGARKIYINGVLVGEKVDAYNMGSQPMRLAKFSDGSGNGYITMDEMWIVERELNQSEITELYNSGSGLSYPDIGGNINLTITQNYPTSGQIFSDPSVYFNVSVLVSNGNLSNITHNIYLSNGTLFNQSIKSLTGNNSNYTTFNYSSLSLGHYTNNYLVCGTNISNIASCFISNNYTFTIGASIIEQIYPNSSYETNNATFMINVTLIEGSTLSLAQLVFDNINYSVNNVTINNNSVFLIKSIDLPTINVSSQNKSYYWRFLFSNSAQATQETPIINITINRFYFSICNSTLNISTLNFSIIDENTKLAVNSNFKSDFIYYLGSGTTYKNYSYSDLTSTANKFGFCISNNTLNVKVQDGIEYSATNYEPRTYFIVNATLNSTIQFINLSLLNNTLSTKFYLTVYNGVSSVPNAYVYVMKETVIGSRAYEVISIRKTDSNSEFVEYLEVDKNYNVFVYKDGALVGSQTFNALCASTPCQKTIQLASGSSVNDSYADFFASGVAYNLYYDNVDTVYATYVDTTGLASYVRLLVYSLNKSSYSICDTKLYSVSGTISCNLSAYQGHFKAELYISRSPEKVIEYITFVRNEVANQLGKTGILIAIVLTLILEFILFKADIRAGLIAFPIILLLFTFMGLLAVPLGVISGIFIAVLIVIGLAGKDTA